MGTTFVNGIEVGPDGKTEWAKIAAGDDHMIADTTKAKGYDGSSPIGGRVYHAHALREAFIAGAEWQEQRKVAEKPTQWSGRLMQSHQDVLQALFEADVQEMYEPIANIAINLGRTKRHVRLICRSLKRKGLAKQVAWHNDDGFICGSGYGITPKGVEYAQARGWKGGE